MALLNSDDLNVGELITVHSVKDINEPVPFMGQAFVIKAVERPFVVLEHYISKTPLTLDERYINFMKVSKNFAGAQVNPNKQPENPIAALFGIKE